MAIWFNSEIEGFEIKNKKKLKEWIKGVISKYRKSTGTINYIFVDDLTIYQINSEFLKHKTYTDIISFDYSEKTSISGDIFISIDRVKENSNLFNTGFDEELKRVIIHGIYHFIGFNDYTENDKMKMRNLEDDALISVKHLLIT